MKTPLLTTIAIVSVAVTLYAEEPAATPAAEPTPDAAAAPSVVQAEDTATLESKVGSEVIVEGFVKDVGQTSGGGLNFINFGDRKTGFTAVVFRSSLDNFPEGLDKYSNQKVRVRGTLEKYQDRQLQIKVSTPDQLEIVSVAP
ncbi:MAG: OB-fold nucleic acid binding domain-containing protein [Chthoniobacterales bacterium]